MKQTNNQTQVSAHPLLSTLHDDNDDDDNQAANSPQQSLKTKQNKTKQKTDTAPPQTPRAFFSRYVFLVSCVTGSTFSFLEVRTI